MKTKKEKLIYTWDYVSDMQKRVQNLETSPKAYEELWNSRKIQNIKTFLVNKFYNNYGCKEYAPLYENEDIKQQLEIAAFEGMSEGIRKFSIEQSKMKRIKKNENIAVCQTLFSYLSLDMKHAMLLHLCELSKELYPLSSPYYQEMLVAMKKVGIEDIQNTPDFVILNAVNSRKDTKREIEFITVTNTKEVYRPTNVPDPEKLIKSEAEDFENDLNPAMISKLAAKTFSGTDLEFFNDWFWDTTMDGSIPVKLLKTKYNVQSPSNKIFLQRIMLINALKEKGLLEEGNIYDIVNYNAKLKNKQMQSELSSYSLSLKPFIVKKPYQEETSISKVDFSILENQGTSHNIVEFIPEEKEYQELDVKFII